MPVTIVPSSNKPRLWAANSVKSTESLLQLSCPNQAKECKLMIQSSFQDLDTAHISSSSNGFIYAAYQAYSRHYHLKIRPEDVWFSILVQLSFYVNKHAEELRSMFVAHEGKKEVEVSDVGTIHSVDFGKLAVAMTNELENHIIDPDLRKWIMPDFTTTENNDKVVAAILMMGTLQKYFSYSMSLMCGIPSVTILGEREDWVKLRARLDKIPSWGKEPAEFTARLTTVLDYFIRSFDDPTNPDVLEFWNKIADYRSGGSGPTFLSGWITSFCFWSAEGERLSNTGFGSQSAICEIGGTTFKPVDTQDIPAGYASVPVKVDDNGTVYKTKMLAGSVGHRITSSGGPLDHSNPYGAVTDEPQPETGPDTVQPVVGWWMYEHSE